MKSIELVIKYYKTSGLDIPQSVQELIGVIDKLSPCEQGGYRQEIERLKAEKDDLILVNKGRKALIGAQFKCMEKVEKEKGFWKATLHTVLEENESGDGVENEMYEYERALQQALKERE